MAARSKDDEEEDDEDRVPLPAAPPELAYKSATENEIVRWVARNIDNPHPNAGECPDPFAWTLLRQCRDQGLTAWFIEKLWGKLVSIRKTEDERDSKILDGQPTVDLIERIQNSLKDFAPKVKPKAVPNAFAKYNHDKETRP